MPVEYAYVATSVGFCAGRLMANVPLDGNCRNCTRLPVVVRSSMYIRTDDVMPSGPSGVEPSPTREISTLYGLNGTAGTNAGVLLGVCDGDGVCDAVIDASAVAVAV